MLASLSRAVVHTQLTGGVLACGLPVLAGCVPGSHQCAMSAGGSSSAETTPILWGICALPGNHGAHAQWGTCSAHAPCVCSGFEGAHLRFHPSCQAHDAKRQRSDVWPSLTSGIPEGNVTWSKSPGDMAWFFGVPSCVNVGDQEVAMHVRISNQASVPCSLPPATLPPSCNLASLPTHARSLASGAQICEAHSTFARQTPRRLCGVGA